MGIEPRKWGFFFDTAKAEEAASKIINGLRFSIKSGCKVKDLGMGEMQQVEICRMLYNNADIIILDEPTSVLTEQEASSLFKTLKALAAGGKSLILITHKLREIKLVCDRVAVLRRGELIGIKNNADIDEYEIARMMTGDNSGVFPGKFPPAESHSHCRPDPVIVFDNVSVLRRGQKRPLLDRVSFSVREGEILGLTGVGGNGLGVLEAALGGFLHPASGKILHKGRDISGLNIRRLRNQGLAYVPADRMRVGSAPGGTLDENIMINRRKEFRKGVFLDHKAIRDFSGELVRRYNIRGAEDKEVSTLSGGNLQKLILAREIDWLRDYVVFSEPAWGLDIVSRDFVWGRISELREKGAAIILVSTDLDEILTLADRIMVMYRGRIAGEFENNQAASLKDRISACMQGLEERE
jgi:simple sugar transport system ATP-binding protein